MWVGGAIEDYLLDWVITPKPIAVPAFISSFDYDGDEKVAVNVPADAKYTVTGHKGTGAGDYEAIAKLTDAKNYVWKAPGNGNKDYKMPWAINPVGMPKPSAIEDQTYTSQAIEPRVYMFDKNDKQLQPGQDFVATYDQDPKVGEKIIDIAGLGNYAGSSQSHSFLVVPVALPAIEEMESLVYTGDALEPGVTMTFGMDKPLVPGKDYTLAYAANQDVGTATVTATGLGNYKDTSAQTFEITPAELPEIKPLEAVDFNGKAYTPDVEMHNANTGRLELDKDYTLAYRDNVNAGTATVTVTGIGNYQNSKEVTFVIKPILMPEIAEIPNLAYTGAALEPEILMKDEATGDLVKDRDFEVVYTNNIDGAMINSKVKDAPFATVTGIGNYKDSLTIEFVIEDTSSPVFNVAEAKESNGMLTITVRDDWGLKSVRVLRNGSTITEEDFSNNSPRVLSYEYKVTFIYPGSYQVFATDLYGHLVNLYNTSGKEEDILKAGRFYGDKDKDGLTDFFETSIGTDPEKPDTDGDGLSDGDEHLIYRTRPLLVDSDGDGLTDYEEVTSGYFNPNAYDTDADGISDTLEAKLREGIAANTHKSSLALELLLNINRTGLKPALSSADQAQHLNDLVSYNLIQLLDKPYEVATERTRVKYSFTGGEGGQKIQAIAGTETMMVKLEPAGTQLAMFEHTLLKFAANEQGKFGMVDALNLNLLTDKDGKPALTLSDEARAGKDTAVVLSDKNGTILLIANWNAAEQKAEEDLILVHVESMTAYRLPGSAGATRFDVSPGGSRVAFLNNGKITLIDLKETDQYILNNKASLIAFTEQEQLIIRLSGGVATLVNQEGQETQTGYEGILYTEQPTNNYRQAVLVQNGIEIPFTFATSTSIATDGRVHMRAAPVKADAEALRPEFNSVRIYASREVNQRLVRAKLMSGILQAAD